jgi:hypothetical protein
MVAGPGELSEGKLEKMGCPVTESDDSVGGGIGLIGETGYSCTCHKCRS